MTFTTYLKGHNQGMGPANNITRFATLILDLLGGIIYGIDAGVVVMLVSLLIYYINYKQLIHSK